MATNTKVNGKEYYRITRTIGHKYQDGKKIPVKKQFYGTSKRDAERKYDLWKESKTQNIKDDTVSFGEILELYVSTVLKVNSQYSIGTRELYETAYKTHLKNKPITNIILYNIQPMDLQTFYNDLDITSSALKTLHKFVRGFFDWASRNEYCKNITGSIVVPAKKTVKKQEDVIIWTDDELNQILTSEPDYYLHNLLVFAAYTGMRISELLGLKWDDIDKNIIRVRRQFYRGEWVPPKNNKERTIPIHEKIREIVDTADHKYDLVFTTSLGTPLDYHNVVRSLSRYYKRNNIDAKKFHAYRATFVTNLCKSGVPIQTASKLAGHNNINVTAKYYTSIQYDELADAISKI